MFSLLFCSIWSCTPTLEPAWKHRFVTVIRGLMPCAGPCCMLLIRFRCMVRWRRQENHCKHSEHYVFRLPPDMILSRTARTGLPALFCRVRPAGRLLQKAPASSLETSNATHEISVSFGGRRGTIQRFYSFSRRAPCNITMRNRPRPPVPCPQRSTHPPLPAGSTSVTARGSTAPMPCR